MSQDPTHPEGHCGRCGHRMRFNYSAVSEIWNQVVGTDDNPRGEGIILCIDCFIELCQSMGVEPEFTFFHIPGSEFSLDLHESDMTTEKFHDYCKQGFLTSDGESFTVFSDHTFSLLRHDGRLGDLGKIIEFQKVQDNPILIDPDSRFECISCHTMFRIGDGHQCESEKKANDSSLDNVAKLLKYTDDCKKVLGDYYVTGRPVYDCINDMRRDMGLEHIKIEGVTHD